jgi:uncharacterized protein
MLTVLLSGASGFIGSQLARHLSADGHRVVRLARPRHRPASAMDSVAWDPEAGRIDEEALARARPDVVVNLAGEPIAQRWTPKHRQRIRDSRVNGTAALARAIAILPERPAVLVSGSAMGYYGAHRGDEVLSEESAPATDFLARTAMEWEQATAPAADAGVRVVLSRTGLVLGKHGGALQRMLLPFRLGIGGRLGSGRQWMSWISLEDTVRALRFLIDSPAMRGPVNVVAPEPVRNVEFTAAMGEVLHRPALLPVPAVGLRMIFGTMADNTLLASQRMVPKRLAGAGFEFRHPHLKDALRAELTR